MRHVADMPIAGVESVKFTSDRGMVEAQPRNLLIAAILREAVPHLHRIGLSMKDSTPRMRGARGNDQKNEW